VDPEGEDEHCSGKAGMQRCGYLLPASTRRAVDFDGKHRHPHERRTDRGVDIQHLTRLETLCDRTVSAITDSADSRGIVDIPRQQPIRTL